MSDIEEKIQKVKGKLERIGASLDASLNSLNAGNHDEYMEKNELFFDNCRVIYGILDQWPIYQYDPAFLKYVKSAQRWANEQEKSYRSGHGFNHSLGLPIPKMKTLDEEMLHKARMTTALNRKRSSAYQAEESKYDDIQTQGYPLLFHPSAVSNAEIASFRGSLYEEPLEQARERLAVVRARKDQVSEEIRGLGRDYNEYLLNEARIENLRAQQLNLWNAEQIIENEINQIETYLSQRRQSCVIA